MIPLYVEKPVSGYEPFTPSDPGALTASLRPGDVLLVEGNNHVSGIIKYLTQSTWSHAALYVGPIGEPPTVDGGPLGLGGRWCWWRPTSARAWSALRCRNISNSTPASAARSGSPPTIARACAPTR